MNPDGDEGDEWDRVEEQAGEAAETHRISRRRFLTWFWRAPVILAAIAIGVGIREAVKVHFDKEKPNPDPRFTSLPPVPIAPLSHFQKPWDQTDFQLGEAASLQARADYPQFPSDPFNTLPAIALRLPAPIPGGLTVEGKHYAAFSRVCTHMGCIVALNEDLQAIAIAFNYQAKTPELVCHCHLSVYNPLEGAAVVSGPAPRPLPRIKLAIKNGRLYAVGLEVTA